MVCSILHWKGVILEAIIWDIIRLKNLVLLRYVLANATINWGSDEKEFHDHIKGHLLLEHTDVFRLLYQKPEFRERLHPTKTITMGLNSRIKEGVLKLLLDDARTDRTEILLIVIHHGTQENRRRLILVLLKYPDVDPNVNDYQLLGEAITNKDILMRERILAHPRTELIRAK